MDSHALCLTFLLMLASTNPPTYMFYQPLDRILPASLTPLRKGGERMPQTYSIGSDGRAYNRGAFGRAGVQTALLGYASFITLA